MLFAIRGVPNLDHLCYLRAKYGLHNVEKVTIGSTPD